MRGYKERCQERLDRLRRRVHFLDNRVASRPGVESGHDKAERSAILWAIEEVERWDTMTEILLSDQSDTEKLAAIAKLLKSRLRSIEQDVARTPALAGHGGPGGEA